MTKKIIWLVVVAIVIVGAISFMTRGPQDAIRIGSISILTGNAADGGIAAKNGIDMAIESVNLNGGINGRRLVAFHEDSQADVKTTISAFQKLTTVDNINIIIGPTWSNTGLALVELAKERGILLISPGVGAAEFNEASKFIFNTRPHDFILSGKLAEYVYEKGHRKVAIIGAQQIWVKEQTNTFKKKFEELGGEVVVLLEPNPENTDVSTDALKIKENEDNIDAIISTTDGVFVGVRIAKKVRELGVELPIYSVIVTADIVEAADGAYEGMEIIMAFSPTLKFQANYIEKYGIEADISSDSAYDAVMLIVKAMRATKSTDPDILQEYLNKVEEYTGVSGVLISDGKGGFAKDDLVAKKVVNGVIIDIDN